MGCHVHFSSLPPLSLVLIPLSGYSPTSFKGNALLREVMVLMVKGAVELASPSLVFCSHLFAVWKASNLWRHVIGSPHLTEFILQTRLSIVKSVGSLLYSEG